MIRPEISDADGNNGPFLDLKLIALVTDHNITLTNNEKSVVDYQRVKIRSLLVDRKLS